MENPQMINRLSGIFSKKCCGIINSGKYCVEIVVIIEGYISEIMPGIEQKIKISNDIIACFLLWIFIRLGWWSGIVGGLNVAGRNNNIFLIYKKRLKGSIIS